MTPDLLRKVAEAVFAACRGDAGAPGFPKRVDLDAIVQRVLADHAEVLDAPDSVDVETVRRALAGWASAGDWSHVDVLFAAAAAWLRDHERRWGGRTMSKHCERCGAGELLLSPDSDGPWLARLVERAWDGEGDRWQPVRLFSMGIHRLVLMPGDHKAWALRDFDRWQRIVPPAEPKEQR